jgi:hypothetical protein
LSRLVLARVVWCGSQNSITFITGHSGELIHQAPNAGASDEILLVDRLQGREARFEQRNKGLEEPLAAFEGGSIGELSFLSDRRVLVSRTYIARHQ